NVRTPQEREGDLAAQIASCRLGERRLQEVVRKHGVGTTDLYAGHLLNYSARMMRGRLRSLGRGLYRAEDFLDSDGTSDHPLVIRVAIRLDRNRAVVDFTGSAAQCAGNVNAVQAIAVSAVYYVSRSLLSDDVPATSGLLR